MHSDKNLQFIRAKIMDIQVALFHCCTDSILRIQNTVIKTSKVDDDGNIWFFIPRPQQLISQFDQAFYVQLKYFKKGSDFSLDISGKGRMLTDPEELNWETELSLDEINRALCTHVLIKVKIQKVDFFEHISNHKSLFGKMKSMIYGLLDWSEPNGKSYEFENGNTIGYGF